MPPKRRETQRKGTATHGPWRQNKAKAGIVGCAFSAGNDAVESYVLQLGEGDLESEVMMATVPVLLACMHMNPDFKEQKEALEYLASAHAGTLKVCLLEPGRVDTFRQQLEIAGTPTFILFQDGKQVDRIFGWADKKRLETFILPSLSTY